MLGSSALGAITDAVLPDYTAEEEGPGQPSHTHSQGDLVIDSSYHYYKCAGASEGCRYICGLGVS